MKNRGFHHRLGFAFAGVRTGWASERSFRTQAGMAGLALLALVLLRPAPVWWALVAVTCAAVLALELVNSAVEAALDLLYPGIHQAVKAAKDMLAGAVVLMSFAALAVAGALAVESVS